MNTMIQAFNLLHPLVRQAVSRLGWHSLRFIQIAVINAYFATARDLLISSPTASGKTEAIFLPGFSDILNERNASVQILYISPLKALINDQHGRLEPIAKGLGIAVHAWHGDIDDGRKQAVRRNPEGILIVTPESLEAMLMNRSGEAATMFAHLQLVVIDEIHAMLNEARGIHLQSLLARLFTLIGYRPRLVGLSATIGDPKEAQAFLNPDAPETVEIIADKDDGRELQIALIAPLPKRGDDEDETTSEHDEETPVKAPPDPYAEIIPDIAQVAQDGSNLVFCNSRRVCEMLSAKLHHFVEESGWSDDPYASHHGSLSKEVRHATERRLKRGLGVTAFATSSLELGIDIGEIRRVLQIDPPWTVSSLRQRLGRSGRKDGQPSTLRLYVIE